MDKIFVLNDGKISDSGSYKELLHRSEHFQSIMLQNMDVTRENTDTKAVDPDLRVVLGGTNYKDLRRKSSISVNPETCLKANAPLLQKAGGSTDRIYSTFHASKIPGPRRKMSLKRRVSLAQVDMSQKSYDSNSEELEDEDISFSKFYQKNENENPGKEKIKKGTTTWNVYWFYLSSMNIQLMLISVSCMVIQQGIDLTSKFWLSFWSEDPMSSSPDVRNYYLAVYGGTGAMSTVFLMVSYFSFAWGGLTASNRIHNQVLSNVLGASMAFFEDTSQGMVMSRFSKDIDTVDKKVCLGFQKTLMNTLQGK